jgi:primosomal protein N' (replication factor Y)
MQFLHAAKRLLQDAVRDAAGRERHAAGAHPAIELHGPLPAPMPRRAGMHRAQLLVSTANRRALHGALDAGVPVLHGLPEARKVRWSLDVDPVDLY